MTAVLEVAGFRAKSIKLSMPTSGVWMATAELDEIATLPSGKIVLRIGDTECSCVVDPTASGTFLVHTVARVIGGVGGWQKKIGRRAYHNDAGVSIASVVSTTAVLVGETLAEPLPTGRTNADWTRPE